MDILEEEGQEKLNSLLEEFEPVFDSSDKTQANVPEIDIPLKNKFENKIFFRPEPWSPLDQEVIDRNAEQLIADKRVFFNPKSRHNIRQVIVPRVDKNGIPVAGRERV